MSGGIEDTYRPTTPKADAGRPARLCPACAKELDEGPNFCPACGADLRGGGRNDSLPREMRDLPIDGRYRIIEKLGEGGMGAVYKVEHVRMGKIAALKLMRPDFASDKALTARFLQEARAVARLSHPNTVQVFDTGELDDGSLYIAMEYVPGKDLAWHLKANGPMAEEKAAGIGLQVLASLAEAHEAGVVHRDIKPANIMLLRRRKTGDDQVKLLDFGIAKLQEAEGRKSTTGDFVGTPAYMSPEQIRGEHIDARSDLYSVGALLFELVTGRQLFVGPTPMSVITQHAEGPVPRVATVRPEAQVSPAFEAVLQKALSKKVDERFGDAEAMRAALEGIRKELGAAPNDFTPMPQELAEKMLSREDFDRFETRLRLRRGLAPFIALTLLAGGVALAFKAFHTVTQVTVSSHELEPNDDPGRATPIALATDVTGAINARSGGEADRDLYTLELPRDQSYRATVTGVPDLNVTLEVLQLEKTAEGEKLKRRLFLDDVGLGGDERVDGLALLAGRAWLRVEEKPFCTEPNRPPREKSLVPYTLRLEPLAPCSCETEPNDTELTAQPLPLTRALTGFAAARVPELDRLSGVRPDAPFSAADWFRVDAPAQETVTVAVVPPERGSLLVLDGAAWESWRQKKAASPRSVLPLPEAVVVKGAPRLVELKALPGVPRRLRVLPDGDTLAGATYQLAAMSSGDNGLAGLFDLARMLSEQNRPEARRQLLEAVEKELASSPELPRVKEALKGP